MKERIRGKIAHAATPSRVAVLLVVAVIATPSWYTGSLVVSKIGLALAVLGTIAYTAYRPSEWQLRHLIAEDPKMIVPLRKPRSWLPWKEASVGGRSGDPPGSPSAVELTMDRSVMVLGETGSGKTKAIEVLAHQMQAADDEPLIAFDYKEDYQRFFDDVIRISSLDSDAIWNIFQEIETEDDCQEIAKAIFSTAENNYFANTAAQVFEGCLILLHRWGEQDDRQPTNADLLEYVKSADVDTLRQDFEDEDISYAKHMSEEAEASENIISNLQMQVGEVFSGDFAKEGDFSVREYMADPQGKTLIFDFPIERSASVKPIFRLLIDWSIRFGMMDDRGAFFVLDEFAGLPRLAMLERLVNVGRAYNCYAIFGIQAVSQVNSTYGRDDAESLLSGMPQEIHLRVGDSASIEYVRQRLGKHSVTRGEGEYERRTEEHAMSPREIQNLDPGRGVIHTTTGWQRGRLYMLSEVINDLLPQERSTFQRFKRHRQRLAKRLPALDSGTEEKTAVAATDRPEIEESEETEPADD